MVGLGALRSVPVREFLARIVAGGGAVGLLLVGPGPFGPVAGGSFTVGLVVVAVAAPECLVVGYPASGLLAAGFLPVGPGAFGPVVGALVAGLGSV